MTLNGGAGLGVLSLILLALLASPAHAVQIDGRLDADEWRDARHVTDFRKTQPLTGETPSLTTEAWVLAVPEGLAVAFRLSQPPTVPRSRQRVQRDFEEQVDRVDVMIDFDGDRRTGYCFQLSSTDGVYDAIITNEKDFNKDWDGNWRHAVIADEEGWTAEILIPWHIAPMRAAANGSRTLNLFLDRVIVGTGERAAWPFASTERARFLSDFMPIEVPAFSQALLAITPYASSLHDFSGSTSKGSAGADLFWKPNGQMQLSAAVNPDFGQVESDDLVVNLDATETFISDKRPFFTENQGIFEFTTPSDYSQLLYTRRIGAPSDDGSGAARINAALKLNGSIGGTKYGVFAADEANEAGRTFSAVRLVRDLNTQNLGLLVTNVDRPFLDRNATTIGIDHNWRPTGRWNVRTRLMSSDIRQSGESTRGDGASVWADYEMDGGWRQQWIAMHFSNRLEINDAGYLSRASMNYLHYQVNKRFTDLPESSRYASKDWRWRVTTNHNDHGEPLGDQFRMSRESRLRNGSYEYAQININEAGVDDLITRGHGVLKLPPNFNSSFEYQRPREGRWAYDLTADAMSGGLAGNHEVGFSAQVTPTYFINDAFNVFIGLKLQVTPDWLVWQRDNLIGSFRSREADLDFGFNWTVTNRQELRLKLQAIGLTAELRQAYRVDSAGTAVASDDQVNDFSVRNLGVQLRYRFEIAPLSYLYVVYGRGGYEQETFENGYGRALKDSFRLHADDQFFVKFSYRFES